MHSSSFFKVLPKIHSLDIFCLHQASSFHIFCKLLMYLFFNPKPHKQKQFFSLIYILFYINLSYCIELYRGVSSYLFLLVYKDMREKYYFFKDREYLFIIIIIRFFYYYYYCVKSHYSLKQKSRNKFHQLKNKKDKKKCYYTRRY